MAFLCVSYFSNHGMADGRRMPGQFDHHMWWLGDLPSSRSCLSAVVEWEATPTHYGYNMI